MTKSETRSKINTTCAYCGAYKPKWYISGHEVPNWCAKINVRTTPETMVGKCFEPPSSQTTLPENLKYNKHLIFSLESKIKEDEKVSPVIAVEKQESEPEWSDFDDFKVVTISKYQKWGTGKDLLVERLFGGRVFGVFDNESRELMLIQAHEETAARNEILASLPNGRSLEVSRSGNRYVLHLSGKAKAEQ